MFGYGKGKGKSYFDNRGYGKGNGCGYSHDRWNANEWNNSFKKKSHKDSTRIDYTLRFHCGYPCHNADSCTHDVDHNKHDVIKDIYFGSQRLLERERERNFFTFGFGDNLKDKFDLTARSHSKYAILLAGFPATTSPHVFREIKRRLDNWVAVFPYCAYGSSFVFVSALAFFKDESIYKHAFRLCNGRKFPIGPHRLAVTRARKSTIKRILRGVNPQVGMEGLKISLPKKRRKKDDSFSSSSWESDISDDSSESDSSSPDNSSRNRKGKGKSKKRDGPKNKRAQSLPSLVDSRDEAMDDDTPSIVVDNSDDDGIGVSPKFEEYAEILVHQSTASQNFKFCAHDHRLEALRREMDNQRQTVQELQEKFHKHAQELPGKFKQSEDNVVARLLAACSGTEHAPGKGKGKETPSPTISRCRPDALEVPTTEEPRRSPRTRDHGPE